MRTPGLIVLNWDHGYRFDGFLDPAWTDGGSGGPRDTEVKKVVEGSYWLRAVLPETAALDDMQDARKNDAIILANSAGLVFSK